MNIDKLTPGDIPDKVNVFIEISDGSSVKYEIDKESGVLFADRFVHGALFYPVNYGFIPGTHAEDGDCVDVLVLASYALHPGTVVKCRILGLLEMEDEEGIDTKIIAVPTAKIDPFMAEVTCIEDIPAMKKAQIKNFFDRYKRPRGREMGQNQRIPRKGRGYQGNRTIIITLLWMILEKIHQ
ncbi:MAG: Inorganic pyrophosphatase [Microgenomates bacterium OLB22]|nr:MAG: Inorganic pyrophosphatase [Microgenomates bacterium OLB22]